MTPELYAPHSVQGQTHITTLPSLSFVMYKMLSNLVFISKLTREI